MGSDSQTWKADKTLQAYLLQEAEATSRAAKVQWCQQNGLDVANLQHDGIFVRKWDETRWSVQDIEKGMERAASNACGYEVQIEGKRIGDDTWQLPSLTEITQPPNSTGGGLFFIQIGVYSYLLPYSPYLSRI